MTTLTVGKADDEPWAIVLDGVTVETVRGHDAAEVLLRAETYVAGDVLWRLTDDGGFEAVIGRAALPVCPACAATTEYCGQCGASLES